MEGPNGGLLWRAHMEGLYGRPIGGGWEGPGARSGVRARPRDAPARPPREVVGRGGKRGTEIR